MTQRPLLIISVGYLWGTAYGQTLLMHHIPHLNGLADLGSDISEYPPERSIVEGECTDSFTVIGWSQGDETFEQTIGWAAPSAKEKNESVSEFRADAIGDVGYGDKSNIAEEPLSCDGWAAQGECSANPGYMLTSCARACRLHRAREAAAEVDEEAYRAWADAAPRPPLVVRPWAQGSATRVDAASSSSGGGGGGLAGDGLLGGLGETEELTALVASRCRLEPLSMGGDHASPSSSSSSSSAAAHDGGRSGTALILELSHSEGSDTNIYHNLAFSLNLWCLLGVLPALEEAFPDDPPVTLLQGGGHTTDGNQWIDQLFAAVVGRRGRSGLVQRLPPAPGDRNASSSAPSSASSSASSSAGSGDGGGQFERVYRLALSRQRGGGSDRARGSLWDSWAWEQHRLPSPLAETLGRRVRHGVGAEARPPHMGTVLLLLRSGSEERRLLDAASGTAAALAAALGRALAQAGARGKGGWPRSCAEDGGSGRGGRSGGGGGGGRAASSRGRMCGVEVAAFAPGTPLAVQAATLARAAVVVSVHGAQLANLAWMAPKSAVVEVTLRYGWCTDPWTFPPPPPAATGAAAAAGGPSGGGGSGGCAPYHKADFANMARSFGLRYLYVDPTYVSPRRPSGGGGGINPIAARDVHVNASLLAAVVARAYAAATDAPPCYS